MCRTGGAAMPDLICCFPRHGPCSLVAMPYVLAIHFQLLQRVAGRVMGTEVSCYPGWPRRSGCSGGTGQQ